MSADPPEAAPPGADPAALLRDWQTLVETELVGIAGDRELRETWQAMLVLWANAAHAFAPAPARDPPRPAPTAAAPGAGQPADRDAIAALLARIDALERRLDELESAPPRPAAGPPG